MIVAFAVADIAGDVYIGQEVHLYAADAVSLARLASAALDVEREPPCLVAAHVCVARRGKKVAYVVEKPGVGRGVGARRAPYGALVDVYHLVKEFYTVYAVAVSGTASRTVERGAEHGIYYPVDKRGFARARHTGDAHKAAERYFYINIFKIMLPCAAHGEKMPVALAALLRHRNDSPARKICARERIRIGSDLCGSARGDHIPAVNARAGSDIHDIIRFAHHIFVMLDDDNGIPEVAQLLESGYKQIVVALVQPYARLVKHIKHADERRPYLCCQSYALRLAARERPRTTRKRQIPEPDALQECQARTYLLEHFLYYLHLGLGQLERGV